MKPKAEYHVFILSGALLVETALAVDVEGAQGVLPTRARRTSSAIFAVYARQTMIGIGAARTQTARSPASNDNGRPECAQKIYRL
jgi:hypothetical protein